MNTARLIVIRHAQTFDNGHRPPEPGLTPWDLSPVGREQSRELARVLAERLDAAAGVAIFSSTARRAVDTAVAVRAALGGAVPCVASDDLLELGYGDLGVQVKDGREWCRFVAVKKQPWQNGGGHVDDFKLSGGMSHREMMVHARRVVGQYLAGRAGKAVILISHAVFNAMLFRDLLGLPDGVTQHNACINELHVCPNTLAVSSGWVLNDTLHLPAALRDEPAPPTLDDNAVR